MTSPRKDANLNHDAASAWPFPTETRGVVKSPEIPPRATITVDEISGKITDENQPEHVFVPISHTDLTLCITEFRCNFSDGHYWIQGQAEIEDDEDCWGIIGDATAISDRVTVSVYPEHYVQKHNPGDDKADIRTVRSEFGFTAAREPDDVISGWEAKWYAAGYVSEEAINEIVRKADRKSISRIVITLTLNTSIFLKQRRNSSLSGSYSDLHKARKFLRPSALGNDPQFPETAMGSAASIGFSGLPITLQRHSDDNIDFPGTDRDLIPELDSVKEKLARLQVSVGWLIFCAIFGGIGLLGKILLR